LVPFFQHFILVDYKQGVLARIIGQASKESWSEALAEQARSLGQKHWPSRQGVSARSIGGAGKKSWLEALAEQARSLNRIHWLSNQQELWFRSFLFRIFLSYQVKIQQYVGIRMQ
jgi:hypothetical protein